MPVARLIKLELENGIRLSFDEGSPLEVETSQAGDLLRSTFRVRSGSTGGPVTKFSMAITAQGTEVALDFKQPTLSYATREKGQLFIAVENWPGRDLEGRRVVVDAGHGGTEPGATAPGSPPEKEHTLSIASTVADLLRKSGAEVLMTRSGDETVSLKERTTRANAWKADLFLSVHINSFSSESAHGLETFHFPGSAEGRILAQKIQTELVSELKRWNRGVKTASFYVLRETTMTSALAEVGFLSNPEERKLLSDPSFRTRAALALWRGVRSYLSPK